MLLHERDTAIATVLSTIITILGTGAAFIYYLSISRYPTLIAFINLLGGYALLLLFFYYYFNWRYEYVAEE